MKRSSSQISNILGSANSGYRSSGVGITLTGRCWCNHGRVNKNNINSELDSFQNKGRANADVGVLVNGQNQIKLIPKMHTFDK